MPNNPDQCLASPNRNDEKDLAAEFAALLSSDEVLDQKSARELLNNILKNE